MYFGLIGKHLNGKDLVNLGLANYLVKAENINKIIEEVISVSDNNKNNEDEVRLIFEKY